MPEKREPKKNKSLCQGCNLNDLNYKQFGCFEFEGAEVSVLTHKLKCFKPKTVIVNDEQVKDDLDRPL